MDEATKQVIKERIKGYQEQRSQASKTVVALDGAIAALIELLENDAKEVGNGSLPAN